MPPHLAADDLGTILAERRLKAIGIYSADEMVALETAADHRGTGQIYTKVTKRSTAAIVDWRRLVIGTRNLFVHPTIRDHQVVFEGSLWVAELVPPGEYRTILVTRSRRLIHCRIALPEGICQDREVWHTYFYALWPHYKETVPATIQTILDPCSQT